MKITEKQYKFMRDLYREQGKPITSNVEAWLENIPPHEAKRMIDAWIAKKQKRRARWSK